MRWRMQTTRSQNQYEHCNLIVQKLIPTTNFLLFQNSFLQYWQQKFKYFSTICRDKLQQQFFLCSGRGNLLDRLPVKKATQGCSFLSSKDGSSGSLGPETNSSMQFANILFRPCQFGLVLALGCSNMTIACSCRTSTCLFSCCTISSTLESRVKMFYTR